MAHVGALTVLEKKGLLKSVKEYVGVSAGAFVGFSLMLGYTLSELRTLCALFDFSVLRHFEPEDAFEFPTSFGFDSGENLVKLLHSLLRVKGFSTTLTFGEWKTEHPTAQQLRCFAADVYRTEPREFSAAKSPNVSIVEALRASMSLPFYFTPVKDPETGHMLVDGGILHNFPLMFLSPEEREDAIGISFSYEHTRVEEIPDLLVFLSQIYACYYLPRTYEVHKTHKERVIVIPCGHIPAWKFEATREERLEIMSGGEQAAEEFFTKHVEVIAERRKPIRRYSVG